ncbi:MAG: DUF4157 domain-containing protein [Acidimicrobiia bacterium]
MRRSRAGQRDVREEQDGKRGSAGRHGTASSGPDAAPPEHPLLSLQRTAGNQAVVDVLQAKLQVGSAADGAEQEADAVAEQVMRRLAGEPSAAAPVEEGPARPAGGLVAQRAVPPEKTVAPTVGPDGGVLEADTERALTAGRGRGRRLDGHVRRSLEDAFGADFSGVRVHDDAGAHEVSETIQAKAFTLGSDIFFRRGAYDPTSSAGKHLLAHELTHVIQQGGAVAREPVDPRTRAGEEPPRSAEGLPGSGLVLQRWWNPFKSTRGKEPEVSAPTAASHKMTEAEQGNVLSMNQLIAMDDKKKELAAALQAPDPKANAAFVKWRDKAKEAWREAAPDAEPPSDEQLCSTWSKIATAFSKEGGLIDKSMVSGRGAAHGQGGAFSAGSFSSWDQTRIVMGTPEFQTVLDDAAVVADSFADHFVEDLKGLPKGAKVGFWSGEGASEAAKDNCDVALEKSALARSFDWNPIAGWAGGTEAILWASLSNRYAAEVAHQWDKFDVHGFIGPGVRDLTVFDRIESQAILKVLGEEHGSEALKRIKWHGVKVKDRKPDYTVTDGQMKGCFVRGRKTFVENAVMGLREK